MTETRIELDGGGVGFLTLPTGDAPCRLVVFYADALGPRPAMTTMVERLVAAGYAVLQPHIFWREEPYARFDAVTVWGDAPERTRISGLMGRLRADDIVADTRALLGALPARVRRDRFGSTGYCLGGRLSFVLGTQVPEDVAVAGFHAGHLVTPAPDSPHTRVAGLRGEVLLGIAKNDASCTAEHQAVLAAALRDAKVPAQLEAFDALHGWCVPDFPVYDAAEAERHWTMLLGFYARMLG